MDDIWNINDRQYEIIDKAEAPGLFDTKYFLYDIDNNYFCIAEFVNNQLTETFTSNEFNEIYEEWSFLYN